MPILDKLYVATQDKNVSVTTIAKGKYALIDHWAGGGIQKTYRKWNYDFVIVDQGPSSQTYGLAFIDVL